VLHRGQPYASYCRLLSAMQGRDLEMRDAALAALRTPLWTVTDDAQALPFIVQAAK
jgi:hypothetical protein